MRCSSTQGAASDEMRIGAPKVDCRYALRRALPRAGLIRPSQRASTTITPATIQSYNSVFGRDFVKESKRTNPNARNIAVLGGGISGLTTAYNLTRAIPQAKIVLYERNSRVGGWLDSEKIKVRDGEVLFEWGPRSVRPDLWGAGKNTVELVRQTTSART